jgi:hypothetical protein
MDIDYSPGTQYISQYTPNSSLNVYIIYLKYHTKATITKDEDGYQGIISKFNFPDLYHLQCS